MSHVARLEATGKGYRYVWRVGFPSFGFLPPWRELAEGMTLATDAQIDDWIDREAAKGESTREQIEADLESRRADVSSGYEDRFDPPEGK